jgi:protease-4
VTALKYRRDVENQLRALTNTDSDKDLPTVTPSEYLSNNAPSLKSTKSHIAILYAVGDIVDEGDGISGRDMVPEITKLADDKNVCGLVLRVNSGGGSAFASEQIWEALQYFKSKDKPFYVSMGDYAASGGYYISCGADKIYADKTTLTGSIGVFGMIPDFSGLATDKLGVTFSTVESNENAGFMTLVQPMTETQQAAMQNSVNNIYEKFVSRVAAGRHLKVETVKSIAEGRVWIGSSAKQLKLVDELGSLDKAVQDIAKSVGLKKTDVVRYPEIEENVWMQLVQQAGSVSVGGMTLDKNAVLMLHFVEKLRTMNPIQARMQETVVL